MKRPAAIIIVVLLVAGVTAGVAWMRLRDEPPLLLESEWVPREHNTYPGRNVILISIDTLRADHLGCYGYHRNTSANIDLFSRDCILFKNAIAQAPSTLPSHASMFTSVIPPHHGAYYAYRRAVPAKLDTLAEVMQRHGYGTVSYNGGGQVAAIFGMDQGFDVYESMELDFKHPVLKAINWIEENPDRKFFMFLHSYEVHHPYTPGPEHLALFEQDYAGQLPEREISGQLLEKINEKEMEITEEDGQHIINTYDAEIHSMDEAFGKLIAFLKEKDLYEDTLIVFTSDHGEEFGEHGQWGWHSHTLYDELLKVPLLVKLPQTEYASTVVEQQVRIMDIAPTVLEILGLAVPESFEGENLLHRADGKMKPVLFAFSEKDCVAEKLPRSLRTMEWKLLGNRLYDLQADPAETSDVAESNEDMTRFLRLKMDEILSAREAAADGELIEMDEKTEEALRSLGYIR
jgi:arylsulfatase A-like enzyme